MTIQKLIMKEEISQPRNLFAGNHHALDFVLMFGACILVTDHQHETRMMHGIEGETRQECIRFIAHFFDMYAENY